MAMEWFFRNNPFSEDSKLDKCINDVVQFVVKDDKYANIPMSSMTLSCDTNYTIQAQTQVTFNRPFSRFPPYLHTL